LLVNIKKYIQGFVSIVYPHYCAACGSILYLNEEPLCLACLADLPRTKFHNDPENEVARIFWGRIPVVHATSFMYFTKNSRYRQILHELKYNGQQHLGIAMGKLFGLELRNSQFSQVDIIHPVPLHKSKFRQRGYNQSELISRGLSEIMNIPMETNLVLRAVETRTQTKKTRYERWENVRGTFIASNKDIFYWLMMSSLQGLPLKPVQKACLTSAA
jgi:predicted amidophosphoribosyltransferase